MQLVIKDNKVFAIHADTQDINSLYTDCTIVLDNEFNGNVGDDYTITSDITKATNNAKIQAQIDTLDFKRIRASLEPAVKDAATGQTWLDYYTEQIKTLRSQLQ